MFSGFRQSHSSLSGLDTQNCQHAPLTSCVIIPAPHNLGDESEVTACAARTCQHSSSLASDLLREVPSRSHHPPLDPVVLIYSLRNPGQLPHDRTPATVHCILYTVHVTYSKPMGSPSQEPGNFTAL